MAVIRCVKCGRIVSNEFPDHIKLDLMAFVECHHCVNDEVFSDRVVFNSMNHHDLNYKTFELFMKCKFKNLDMEKVKATVLEQYDRAMISKFTKDGYYSKIRDESDKLNIMGEQQKRKVR